MRLRRPPRAPAVPLFLALALTPVPAQEAVAQEDFRSADPDRPLLTEDAFPLKLREWEVEAGLRGRLQEGRSGLEGILELKTGLFLNTQAGLDVEAAWEEMAAGDEAGIESAGGHLLYNFNRETRSWPAFAGRVDVRTPGTGDVGHQDWAARFKGIATRSFDRLRLHANGGYAVAGAEDGGDFWIAGLGFDYPIGLFSKTVLGDVFVEVPADGERARVWVEAGSRWQLTNLSVLDFGVATRADEWEDGNANVQLILGLSRVFGVSGLVRVPPYPDPLLR